MIFFYIKINGLLGFPKNNRKNLCQIKKRSSHIFNRAAGEGNHQRCRSETNFIGAS